MIPIDMIHLDHGLVDAENGDCMRACMVFLLERHDVPHFCCKPHH